MSATDDIDIKGRETAAASAPVSAMTAARMAIGLADATAHERQQKITVD